MHNTNAAEPVNVSDENSKALYRRGQQLCGPFVFKINDGQCFFFKPVCQIIQVYTKPEKIPDNFTN